MTEPTAEAIQAGIDEAEDRRYLRQQGWGEDRIEQHLRRLRPIPSTPDERTEAQRNRDRAVRARDTLDASLRAAGIEGFSTEATHFGRVTVRFDTPTDAFLAATRLAFLRTGPRTDWREVAEAIQEGRPLPLEVEAGEGEPAHYEAIDRPTATTQEAEAARRDAPSIRDWAEAHQAFRAKHGHGANPNEEDDLAELRAYLSLPARPWVERLRDRKPLPETARPWHGRESRLPGEETGRRSGW